MIFSAEGLSLIAMTILSPLFMYYAYDIIQDNFIDCSIFDPDEEKREN